MDLQAKAQDCFDYNLTVNRLHVTIDGTCFPDKQDAIGYARTLNDASIKVFERQGNQIVEVTEKSTEETVEANTAPDPFEAEKKRKLEALGSSGAADIAGQQQELADLLLKVQNAGTVGEVNTLLAGQTDSALLEAGLARIAVLTPQ